MPAPADPEELGLVRKAISLADITGCLEWDEKEEKRLRSAPPIPGLMPEAVRKLLVEFVNGGGDIVQKKETRERWQDRRSYWYKATIPFQGLPKGLFVEFYLTDDDPDYPAALLVNYH